MQQAFHGGFQCFLFFRAPIFAWPKHRKPLQKHLLHTESLGILMETKGYRTYRGALGQPRTPSDTVLNHPLKSPGVAEDV